MTTDEHDNLIIAKCHSLLALAAKRSGGQWHKRHDSILGNNEFGFVTKEEIATKPRRDMFWDENSTYIAACAGLAEAGWLSTIAAIEGLRAIPDCGCSNRSFIYGCQHYRRNALAAIRAAWPKELLNPL
jgi:hypothetical protein